MYTRVRDLLQFDASQHLKIGRLDPLSLDYICIASRVLVPPCHQESTPSAPVSRFREEDCCASELQSTKEKGADPALQPGIQNVLHLVRVFLPAGYVNFYIPVGWRGARSRQACSLNRRNGIPYSTLPCQLTGGIRNEKLCPSQGVHLCEEGARTFRVGLSLNSTLQAKAHTADACQATRPASAQQLALACGI